MRTIDMDKAEQFRAEWVRLAQLWDAEAVRRETAARKDPAKYRATHLQAAKDARALARKYADRVQALDDCVQAHVDAGKVAR